MLDRHLSTDHQGVARGQGRTLELQSTHNVVTLAGINLEISCS